MTWDTFLIVALFGGLIYALRRYGGLANGPWPKRDYEQERKDREQFFVNDTPSRSPFASRTFNRTRPKQKIIRKKT
ncbi:MAG: hypothetical protein ACSHWY_08470 [Octadecabacter sp.]